MWQGSNRPLDCSHSSNTELFQRALSVMKEYYAYIMSNQSKTLYTGVTNDLERRVREHKLKIKDGFTKRYNVTQLVWFDRFDDVTQAIESEKRIKRWRRSKKITMIEKNNPHWEDLAEHW